MSDEAENSKDAKSKNTIENVALGATTIGGTAATAAGIVAAGATSSGALTAAGAVVGGVTGGVVGSSVGLATGGFGMVATIPFATGGAAIGAWGGSALTAVLGIGTAPVWAVPVAVGGGVVVVGSALRFAYKYGKSKKKIIKGDGGIK